MKIHPRASFLQLHGIFILLHPTLLALKDVQKEQQEGKQPPYQRTLVKKWHCNFSAATNLGAHSKSLGVSRRSGFGWTCWTMPCSSRMAFLASGLSYRTRAFPGSSSHFKACSKASGKLTVFGTRSKAGINLQVSKIPTYSPGTHPEPKHHLFMKGIRFMFGCT